MTKASFETSEGIWVFPKIMVPPKSSILIGFSIINHPFWGTSIFGNTHLVTSNFLPFHLLRNGDACRAVIFTAFLDLAVDSKSRKT